MSDKQIVKSEFETSQDGIAYKKYDLTEYGRSIANTHAKSEIEKHSQLLIPDQPN